jgi:hypothetical protein
MCVVAVSLRVGISLYYFPAPFLSQPSQSKFLSRKSQQIPLSLLMCPQAQSEWNIILYMVLYNAG